MRTSTVLFAVLALCATASCKKEKAPDAPPAAAFARVDTTPLWKMVPSDAMAAMIVSEGSLAHLHDGFVRFIKDFRQAPGGPAILAEMKQEAELLDKIAQPGAAKLVGADLSKGAAAYVTTSEMLVLVLPIVDKATFLAVVEGTVDGEFATFNGGKTFCKEHSGYYVCADDKDAIATIGGGGGMKQPEKAKLRGHLEGYVSEAAMAQTFPDGSSPIGAIKEVRTAVVLEPGGMTTRLWVDADVPAMFRSQGSSALLKDLAQKSPTGILSVHAGTLMKKLLDEIPSSVKNDQGPFGLTPGAMLDVLTGDAVAYALPGEVGGELRVGITSKAPFESLLPLCGQIPPQIGKGSLENGRCNFEITPPGGFPIAGSVWLTDKALHVGLADFEGKRKNRPALQRMGKDIIDGQWLFASWGYGSFAPHMRALAQIPEVSKELGEPPAQMALWSILHLSEFGFAVGANDDGLDAIYRLRTTWSNPASVTDQLEPLFARIAKSDFGAIDEVLALAKKHPKSPLAFDVKGGAGIAAPVSMIGIWAAVSIPAFVKYTKKSKTSEGRMFVKKMSDGAQAFAMDQNGAFPAQSTPITPPLGACCSQGDKCMPDATLWQHPTWVALGFSVDDPHYYSYQYEVGADGKSYTARAFGDLDCDGQYSTFEMVGEIAKAAPRDLFKNQELE